MTEKPDYKHTLNLPKTAFPMKANLAQREPAMLAKWQQTKLYDKIRHQNKDAKKFILHDGPPYANGDIHIGHVLNKVLKDMVCKSQTLNGLNAPFVPGWDCHGLPIEVNVEKKKGRVGHKISAKDFRKACREYAKGQVAKQSDQFQRLGILAEWDNPYLTMNYNYEADVVRSLGGVLKAGYIVRGAKPVHWCIDCGSALADTEVEYQEKRSIAIDVRFKVLDEAAFLARCQHSPEPKISGPISIPIWTTTPWTLPANEAVTLGPDINYALLQCELAGKPELLLVAEDLIKDVVARYGVEDYHVAAYNKGQAFEGALLQHPFLDKQVPVCLGDHVTVENGTGAVHTAPAHGDDDFIVAKKYHLPVNMPVLDNGCYAESVPLFAGKFVRNVDADIVALLNEKGVLLHEEALQHSYPHCWRHKTPLIFRATSQWFVSMSAHDLRQNALQTVKNVQWLPETGAARMNAMLANRPDWCISRQRSWGVPIPFITHKETGDMHPNMQALIDQIAGLIEKEGIDAWFDVTLESLIGDEASHYEKSPHVLDVWFDSGVSHTSVLKARQSLAFPADLYLEGADQHRGWFQTGLLTSQILYGQAPYKTVVTHGFTVDGEGKKMSKSLGNTVVPEKLIKTLGADMLRLWVASTDYQRDMSISDEILKRTSDAYRRLRNTARFLLSNLDGFDPSAHLLPFDQLVVLDRWAIAKAYQVQTDMMAAYNRYEFHQVVQLLQRFCIVDMGNFYLDIIKDRQYTAKRDCHARLSAQTAMYHVIQALVRWLAPILSFTADEIWQHIPGEKDESVFLSVWYDALKPLPKDYKMNLDFWAQMSDVRDAVNKEIEAKRSAGLLGSGLEAVVTLYCDGDLHEAIASLSDELRFVLITSEADVKPLSDAPDSVVVSEVAGLSLRVDVTQHAKCERCWHRRADVNQFEGYPGICGRCVDNIAGDGEVRHYA